MAVLAGDFLVGFDEIVAVSDIVDHVARRDVERSIALLPDASLMWAGMRRGREGRVLIKRSDQNEALSALRHAVVRCQDGLLPDAVSKMLEGLEEEIEPRSVVVGVRKSKDILEQE